MQQLFFMNQAMQNSPNPEVFMQHQHHQQHNLMHIDQ
jgi:hypothetical protein